MWFDMFMAATTNHNTGAAGEGTVAMTITNTFKSFDGSTVHVLSNGQAVRCGITGRMLLTEVGGQFVRYLADDEIPAAVR